MTISDTRGTELDIDTILTVGMQLAGVLDTGQSADGPDLVFGRRTLDAKLDSLLTKGVYARSVTFSEVLMVPGQTNPAIYSLDGSVLDVVGDGAYIDPTNASTTNAEGETVVQQMDREEWQRLSSKASVGRPYKFYLDRSVTPLQVRLWPTPDEAGTIRFQTQLLTADAYTGSDTVDLRQYWTEYLMYVVAHFFAVAKSLPVEKLSYLNKRAKELGNDARAFGNQHVNNFMRYSADNRWRGR